MSKKRCKVTVEFDLEVSECKRSSPVEITQEILDIFKENTWISFKNVCEQLKINGQWEDCYFQTDNIEMSEIVPIEDVELN